MVLIERKTVSQFSSTAFVFMFSLQIEFRIRFQLLIIFFDEYDLMEIFDFMVLCYYHCFRRNRIHSKFCNQIAINYFWLEYCFFLLFVHSIFGGSFTFLFLYVIIMELLNRNRNVTQKPLSKIYAVWIKVNTSYWHKFGEFIFCKHEFGNKPYSNLYKWKLIFFFLFLYKVIH